MSSVLCHMAPSLVSLILQGQDQAVSPQRREYVQQQSCQCSAAAAHFQYVSTQQHHHSPAVPKTALCLLRQTHIKLCPTNMRSPR